MTYTEEHYNIALQECLENIKPVERSIGCVLLYGSMARGDLRPGSSDILDAFVFLKSATCEEHEAFIETLDALVEACRGLSRHDLPFHPFLYWSEDEPVPAITLRACVEETESRIVAGGDIRPGLTSTSASRLAARTAFFEARRLGYPLMVCAEQSALTPREGPVVLRGLITIRKYVTMLACLALDIPAGTTGAVQALTSALPEIDASVLDEIAELPGLKPEDVDLNGLHLILRRAIALVEALNAEIVQQWDGNL